MSVRSCANVFSLPDDFGSCSATTARSSSPRASCCSQSASEPTVSRSSAGIDGADVDQLVDALRAQLLGGHGSDAPQRIDRQSLQERFDASGRDDRQPIRLLPS